MYNFQPDNMFPMACAPVVPLGPCTLLPTLVHALLRVGVRLPCAVLWKPHAVLLCRCALLCASLTGQLPDTSFIREV